ncbi:hypothetical protein ADK70_17695 [Streptomyces rimosus subsp. pseudoverticillatus]|nr:hypothetical protein ADK70_17695 [Streptomyces rimosus subsp. pseudoverticillatus]
MIHRPLRPRLLSRDFFLLPVLTGLDAVQGVRTALQARHAGHEQGAPPVQVLEGALVPGGGLLAPPTGPGVRALFQLVQPPLAFIGRKLSLISQLLPLVRAALARLGDPFAFVGSLLPCVGDGLPLIGSPLTCRLFLFPPLQCRFALPEPGLMLLQSELSIVESREPLPVVSRTRSHPPIVRAFRPSGA